MLREYSKSNTIELPINKGFSNLKRGRNLKRKSLMTLCQNRVISKFKRAPMLLQNQGSFPLLQIKIGIFLQFSSRSSQQPLTSNQSSNTSNHTSNLEISNYDSRLSFITFRVVKFFGDRIRWVLLYFFIIKSHTDNCTHIYTNQYKLIICYTILCLYDLSFTNFVCTEGLIWYSFRWIVHL